MNHLVTPAEAGVTLPAQKKRDPRFRGDDERVARG